MTEETRNEGNKKIGFAMMGLPVLALVGSFATVAGKSMIFNWPLIGIGAVIFLVGAYFSVKKE